MCELVECCVDVKELSDLYTIAEEAPVFQQILFLKE
jgi:hypothetical protein